MTVRIEDAIFWVLIALIVGIAIWKLFGSPTDTAALISIALFVAASELLIWKKMFSIENKTTVGFMKIKYELKDTKNEINAKLNNIESLIIK